MTDPSGFALDDLIALRRDLHAHPELGFEERRTAALVAGRLRALGLEVTEGVGGTGVVATLGRDGPCVGLRADMDALAMEERSGRPWASTSPGRMHACGHDGHTTLLLGAAARLAAGPPATGRVRFIFQPAEEGRGGARRMSEDGLFERFPCDLVFGLHNMPGLATDEMAVAAGPQLASSDSWRVTLRGVGTHGAKPHLGRDAVTAAGHFLTGLQTIPGRVVDPLQPAVVSACSIQAGDPKALNVIPDEVRIGGTARAYA
ncbi:MAG: amidohydrolase, partial [Pseudomonadota bacterium]